MSKCKPGLDRDKIKEIKVRTKKTPLVVAKDRESPRPLDRTKAD